MNRDTPHQPQSKTDTRAQSPVDFIIAVSLLLIVIVGIIGYLPGAVIPTTSYTDTTTHSDAVETTEYLTETALTDTDTPPHVLNATTTAAYFNTTDADTTVVAVTPSTVPEYVSVNVTVRNDEALASMHGVTATRGPPVPDNTGAVAHVTRVVTVDDTPYTLHVHAW